MNQIVLAIVFAAILFSPQAWADNSLPAALPEFMDQTQMAKWSPPQTASTTVSEPSTQFYTGKPYVADAGGYIFKYRTYNPEMSRWTSADPSGFPDGANNQGYLSDPVVQVDSLGLWYSGTPYLSVLTDKAAWNQIKYWNSSSDPLAVDAMSHADGTNSGNWTLSSAEDAAVKASPDYSNQGNPNSFYDSVQTLLYTSLNGFSDPSSFSTPVNHFLFTHGTDEYYAFGHADLSTSGTVTDSNGQWTYTATVTLTDYYTFSQYSNVTYLAPTALGYRLQTAGYIQPFSTSGTWTDTWTE